MSERPVIKNPVLPGFYPDPSICCAGDDYYLVNSSFEWFPGIPIHHSRDLVNWNLIGHVLTRTSMLDLRGVGNSAGPWAPSLSYSDGLFYLVYTNVQTRESVFKDVPINLTTASDILGPWSEPVSLGSCGFDPSLFHDDDGRKWMVNIQWDFRKGHPRFGGIVLQEYDPKSQQMVGDLKTILRKERLIEGPNLYKKGVWYYLMLAEGGTGWNHGIAMARSRKIDGPYEMDPQEAVLTTRDNYACPLQKAGHGELVQTQNGDWYMAHLCSRPIGPERRCILGRETAIQEVIWSDDGWLRLKQGGVLPALEIPAPTGLPLHPWKSEPTRDDFDSLTLSPHWQSLRVPFDPTWASLSARPGWLRLTGRQSIHSLFTQSLVAKRLISASVTIETCMEFNPTHFTQMAGLVCWYDTKMQYYLRVTHDEARGRVLGIVQTDNGVYDELTSSEMTIDNWPRIFLRAEIDGVRLQYSASPDSVAWQKVGPVLDMSKISDDYGAGLHFTGAMVGLCAQDLNYGAATADFDYFEMR